MEGQKNFSFAFFWSNIFGKKKTKEPNVEVIETTSAQILIDLMNLEYLYKRSLVSYKLPSLVTFFMLILTIFSSLDEILQTTLMEKEPEHF